ncbi:MAG: LysR substrate-binding domain-containing protein [Caulobacteraceae bacterium]
MRTSDFERLKVFAAVAERGSFVKAAGALGVSTSSVSQAVRALEDRLGLRLLNRTTRSVALTEAGARLLERAAPALIELDAAFEDLNAFRAEPAGALKVSVSTLSLSLVVAPMVARFLAAHPAIKVELVISDHADLDAGMDAGVRNQAVIPQDMVAVRVSEPSRFLAVAAPSYLAERGAPERPGDLARHNCIQFRAKSGLYPWTFVEDGRRVEAKVSGSLVTGDGHFMLRAAADGVGVAYVVETHAAAYLASGALEPLLQDYAAPFPGFFLYYPSRRHVPAPLKLFAQFMSAQFTNAAIADADRSRAETRLSILAERAM